MRTLPIMAIILVLGAVVCSADTWLSPTERDYTSRNGRFLAHVTPAAGTARPLLQVHELTEGRRIASWGCTLGNEGAPLEVFLTDDGKCAVTLNEYSSRVHGAWGDYVLAFYNKEGTIRHYSLEQLLGYPEKITEREVGRLVFQTTAGRYWASIKFLREIGGRWLFFAWLDRGGRWLAWDVAAGSEVEVTSSVSSDLDEIARQWAVQDVLGAEQQHAREWSSAVSTLLRLKRPEDRRFVEPLLHAEDFHTSYTADDRAFKRYYAYSPKRNAAEKALAVWDRVLSDESTGNVLDEYRYLGLVRGTIVLPRAPTPADESWLCVYLIPESSKRDDWYSDVPVHRLSVRFGQYHLASARVWPGASIPFVVCGISPGRYHLKAVWDLSSPHTFHDNSISGPPSPGDYENQQSPLIDVTAGGEIRGIIINCAQEVGQHHGTTWSSEVVKPGASDDPPCPCGKEHGRNRVCVVFHKPLPLRQFDWGPYHNSTPTKVINEGATTTYVYVFEKMAADRSDNQNLDMCVRMITRNGELVHVTVEGPYFSVVPLQSFLQALMVQGLDARNLEEQAHVYGGPLRLIRSSLDQVIRVLGRPSEATPDEVIFRYSLTREAENNRSRWVKYKVAEDGLLLEGRTNLAGGISSFLKGSLPGL